MANADRSIERIPIRQLQKPTCLILGFPLPGLTSGFVGYCRQCKNQRPSFWALDII
jgi:hypothetical protein